MWNKQRIFAFDAKTIYKVSIFVVLLSSTVECANRVASTQPSTPVIKQLGDSVDLLCTFGQAIDRCEFETPNGNKIKLRSDWPRADNYAYFGEGIHKGQCGLTIKKLEFEDHGEYKCILDLNDGSEDIIGKLTVNIARPPTNMNLYVRDDQNLEANDELYAECTFEDGSPSPNITWILGDEVVNQSEEPADKIGQNGENLVIYYYRKILRPEDNMKRLICRIAHSGFPNGVQDIVHQLNVNYQPVPLPETLIKGFELEKDAEVVMNISAHPRPRFQWNVDGNVLEEGKQTPKYLASRSEQLEDGKWQAKLKIFALKNEDTLKTITLRADNQVNNPTDYKIKIATGSGTDTTGPSIITTIAITILILFALVVAALLIVARVTKRWCFAGDSMHPNSPDSEAQIAPDDDKTHEHYEQHDSKVMSDDEAGELTKKTSNGKSANGNTSV